MIRKSTGFSISKTFLNLLLLACAALGFSTSSTRAQTATWNGAGGSEWNTPASWDIGVPGVGTNAVIRASVSYNNPMTAANFKTLNVSNTLNINTSGFYIDEAGASTATLIVNSNTTMNIAASQGLTISNSAGAMTVNNGGNIVLANNSFLLVTNSTAGSFNVGASGNPQFGGTFTINSGALATIDKTMNIAGVPSRVFVNGGTLNCLAGSHITENNTDGDQRLAIASGTVNLGDFSVSRCNTPTGGLLLTNGTVNATAIQIGTGNSVASSSVFGGVLTNSGAFNISDTIAITATSGDRKSYFHIRGGTVVSTSANGIIIANQSNTSGSPSAGGTVLGGVLDMVSGTLIAEKITLIKDNTIVNAYASFTMSGGTVYLGSGGLVLNPGSSHIGHNLAFTGGTLGAKASWTSSAPLSIANTVTFKAADQANTPFDIALTGVITNTGSLAKTGGGTLTISGNNTYSGSTTVSAGSLVIGSANSLPRNTSLTIGSSGNAATLDLVGFNAAITGLAVGSGATGANQLITNSSASSAVTITFSNISTASSYSGIIAGGSKPIAITVLGGTLTLSGANNYAGNIFISNGRLALSSAGSIFTGPSIVLTNTTDVLDLTGMDTLALATGQSLAGPGTVFGSITATNCTLIPGQVGTGGTLTITNNLTLNGNVTNLFDLLLDPNAPGSDLIVVSNALTVSGTNYIKLNLLGGSLLEGNYELFQCGSVSGSAANFQIIGSPGTGLQAAIQINGNEVDLVVSQLGGSERVWVGDGLLNLWDHATTNWLHGGNPDVFTDGNPVRFDDSATNLTVVLAEAVHPSAITVDAMTNYIFAGGGKITGAVAITKTNSGTLTILTTNDFSGTTTIEQGTLQLGNGVAAGVFGSGGIEDDSLLFLQEPDNRSLSNAISGSGGLVQAGAATFTLNGSNTFAGGILINSGTLQIGNGGTPGSGNITNNAALTFASSGNNPVTGVLSGSGNVTLSGSGTVSTLANNTLSGTITVSAGTLLVNGTNSGGESVTVNSSGKLGGNGVISGSVVLNSGGALNPGNPRGTLSVISNLTANTGALFNFEVGTNGDKVAVSGNLSLAGTMNISDAGGLGNGTYTLFTYSGGLAIGTFALGTTPPGKICQLDTSTAGQVNLIVGVIATNITAFPGALGFGANVSGGRGGSVYHVTTLADSGAGSFRDAVSSSHRIVVFDVGGYISLASAVSVKGNITIAGQTAPGGGIGFKGGEISFAGSTNIICRYIRVRPGSDTTSTTDDALSLFQAANIIVDHSSIEFAPWNNFDGVGDDTHIIVGITVQNSLIADPTGQQFGAHTESVGGQWSWFYNVFANSHNRNPLDKINSILVNNVLYNCSAGYTTHTGTPFKHDIINNYFIVGPAYSGATDFPWFQVDDNQSIYYSGNMLDTDRNSTLNGSITTPYWYQGGTGTILNSPWTTLATNAPIYTPASAFRLTASRAGALPRDQMDNFVFDQVKTLGNGPTGTGAGTVGPDGSLYTSQTQTGLGNNGYGTITGGAVPLDSDGDGLPDFWETAVGLNPNNANDATNLTLSGYSQLEIYLNWLGDLHAVGAINTNLDIDLYQYASGFTNVSPVFSISNVVNGTAVLLLDTHTVRYTPAANFTGQASFLFKVTGSDGTSMTNAIGIVISGTPPPQNLTWHGDGIANIWNINTNANWVSGTNVTIFRTGDSVTFDDSGSNSPAINLATAVSPGSLTIAASQNYVFSGAGSLTGPAALNKSGNGMLTLNTSNTYAGGTIVDGGTVAVGTPGAVSSGSVTLSGGALQLGGGNFANALSIDAAGTVIGNSASDTLQGLVSGNGTWTINVPASRVVTEESDNSAFTGTIALTGTGTYRLNQGAFTWGNSNAVYDLGVNGILNNRAAAAQTIYLGALTGGANSQLRGSDQTGSFIDTLQVGALNLDTVFNGTLRDGTGATPQQLALSKIGSASLTLNGINTASGTITVNSGTLAVNGISGTGPVTVGSGATLTGSGTLGGDLTAQSGAILSPGGAASAGTLSISNNLNLTSANIRFDFANVTTVGSGVNDLLQLNGGTVNASGTTTILPNLLAGSLAFGNYTLIAGGSATTGTAGNFAWGGVAGTRQSFNFDLSTAGTVQLQVTGSPSASLSWQGTNGNNWDLATTNWLNAGLADRFFNLDTVRFDDTAANGTVSLVGTVLPTAVIVSNNATAYAFSGGILSGTTALQKTGPGLLTIANSNNFTGGTLIQNGTLQLSNDVANQYGLGSGSVTLAGGTLSMFSNANTTNNASWNLIVPIGMSGQLNADAACELFGTLTGAGTLNVFVPATHTTFNGDWSAFTGRINVGTGTNGDFRIASLTGLTNAALNLANNVSAYVPIDPGTDTTIDIGELSGAAGSRLSGLIASSVLTWRVGGRNTDATFSGSISEANTNTTTAIEKIGSGTWTLTGSNTYAGDTKVTAGTLSAQNAVGSATGAGNVDVANGATLSGNGIIGGDTTLEAGSRLAPGSTVGTLTFAGALTLSDTTALQFDLGTSSDEVVVSNTLVAAGILSVSNSGGFGVGTYTLFAYNSGSLTLGNLTLGTMPAGFNYAISTNTPGQVNLIVTLPPPPQFASIAANGNALVMAGRGGMPSTPFYVLTATNVSQSMDQWTIFATNYFDPSGNFIFTNVIGTNVPQGFYRIQVP